MSLSVPTGGRHLPSASLLLATAAVTWVAVIALAAGMGSMSTNMDLGLP